MLLDMVEDPFLVQNVHSTLPDSKADQTKLTPKDHFLQNCTLVLLFPFDLFDNDEIRLIAGHDTLFSVSYQ
jgi:hypothetical protein